MPEESKLQIIKNEPVNHHTYLMLLKTKNKMDVKPGQFLMLKPNDTYDPLNRRAFAIADIEDDIICIYYDIVGKATNIMKGLMPHTYIDALLPLGKGVFTPQYDKLNVVLAGGIGISGVSLFCKFLKAKNIDFKLYYGVKSKEYLIMLDWFQKYSIDVEIYTEDGSIGKGGFVTKAIEDHSDDIIIHACGPTPMLRSVKKIAKQRHLKAYLSLENPMACGYGVCLGCVVKSKDTYIRTCVEGPVLDSEEIEF